MRFRNRERRGSLIVAALMLFAVLLALGLGLMSSQSARMRVARGQVNAVQAKALCEAGWEDVRVKLGKDILFPRLLDGQTFFAYSEDVYADVDGREERIGSYTVIIDVSLGRETRASTDLGEETDVSIPEGITEITISGKVGPRTADPEAERTMKYEIVMSDPTSTGPLDPRQSFKVIRVEDWGSI